MKDTTILDLESYFSSNVSSRSFILECSSALDMVDVDMSSFGNSAVTQSNNSIFKID